MAQHTPTPWQARWGSIRHAGQRDTLSRCVIGTPKNKNGGSFVVCAIEGPFAGNEAQAKANAEFIVEACNAYEGLSKAYATFCEQSTKLLEENKHLKQELGIAKSRIALLQKAMRDTRPNKHYLTEDGDACVLCGVGPEDSYVRCTEPHRCHYPSIEELEDGVYNRCGTCGRSGDI